MKLLYSVGLGLGLIWLVLSQICGQETAVAAAPVNLPATLANSPQPLIFTSFTQTAKLIASNRITGDYLGRVAIDGDTIIVGAGNNAAYIFVKPGSGWGGVLTEVAKLIPSQVMTQGINYGFSVAISGDTVLVGASSENNRGAAYIFVRPVSGWSGTLTETAKLTASDGMDLSYFGYSVAIYSDTIVVGSPGYNSTRGAAYIFIKPAGGWVTTSTFSAKLTASDGADNDFLGDKVTLNGNTIAASASDNNRTGSIYVFNKPAFGWVTTSTFAAKLTAADGAANDGLGYSLGLSQDTIVAGAVGDDGFSGSAYIFAKPVGGWVTTSTFSAKLTASDRAVNDYFGISAGIANDVAIVGAWGNDIGLNTDQGSAYVFVKPSGGWSGSLTETTKLTALHGSANDAFGISVAAQSNLLAVGAVGDDNGKGSAYLFISDTPNSPPKFPAYLPVILR